MKLGRKALIVFLSLALFTSSFSVVSFAQEIAAQNGQGNTKEIPEDAVSFRGNRYKLYTVKMNWEDAKHFCEELGGHLVTINSKEEQDFIVAQGENWWNHIWIGATDYYSGEYEWVTGEPFDYSNWMQNEPSRGYEGTEHFAIMRAPEWDDRRLSGDAGGTGYYFVCEWELDSGVDLPVLDKKTARSFLGFLYNVNEERLTDHFLETDKIYQLITGTIDISSKEELNLYKLSTLLFINDCINRYIKNSSEKIQFFNERATKTLVETWKDYEKNPLMGINPLADITAKVSTSLTNQIIDYFSGLCAEKMGIYISETLIDDVENFKKIAEMPAKSAEEAKDFWDRWIGSMHATADLICSAYEEEYYYRYTYFGSYLSWRKGYDSKDNPIFKMTWEPQSDLIILAARDNYLASGIIETLGSLGGKRPWYEGKDLIEMWAEYVYQLDQSVEPIVTPVSKITLNLNQATIEESGELGLTAQVLPANATIKNIYWSSSDERIATVTQSGLVKSIAPGEVTITAQDYYGKVKTECRIIVTESSHSHIYSQNWYYDKDMHYKECSCGNRSAIEKHVYGEWKIVKVPTVDEEGKKERNCTICGYSENEAIPKNVPVRMQTPKSTINYVNETLENLIPNQKYDINGTMYVANVNGEVALVKRLLGKSVDVICKASDSNHIDSDPQTISIPKRPEAPSAEMKIDVTNNQLRVTNISEFIDCEFSFDGSKWGTNHFPYSVVEGKTYTLWIRTKSTDRNFASESKAVKYTVPQIFQGSGNIGIGSGDNDKSESEITTGIEDDHTFTSVKVETNDNIANLANLDLSMTLKNASKIQAEKVILVVENREQKAITSVVGLNQVFEKVYAHTNACVSIKLNGVTLDFDRNEIETYTAQQKPIKVTVDLEVPKNSNFAKKLLKDGGKSYYVAIENNGVSVSHSKKKIGLKVPDNMLSEDIVVVDVSASGKYRALKGTYANKSDGKYYEFISNGSEELVLVSKDKFEKHINTLANGVKKTKIVSAKVQKIGNNTVKISWKKEKGYIVDSYEIYRKEGKKGKYKKVYTTKSGQSRCYYNSRNLVNGKKYTYKIRGKRVINGKQIYTKWSAVKTLKFR